MATEAARVTERGANGAAKQRVRVIDGDGHIFEDADGISAYLPSPYREAGPWPMIRLFPPLDHLHVQIGQLLPGSFGGGKPVGPKEWSAFMSEVGIDAAVLYPTVALSYGKMVDLDWAIAVTQGYNDWLYHTYMQADPRFKGMALIPIQDPPAAAAELRRAVKELGMPGAMLASVNARGHVGSKELWPIYEEADRLGCAIAFHGGCHSGFGLDDINVYAPVHALGHPYGQMNCFASVIFNGLPERFPNVRWGFLEGGVAWLFLVLERFDRSYETHVAYNPRNELFQLQPGERVSDYVRRQIKAGRIFIGCEGEEPTLTYAVKTVGAEPFVFSSDFPHEVNAEMCKHEMEELLETDELSQTDKEAIFATNAARFYRLQ
jgi:predicted TIM-barrel fold metal-dependent hydrolase